MRRIAGLWKTAQEWRQKMEAKMRAATLAMPGPCSVFMTNAYNAQRRLIDATEHKHFRREVGKLQMSSKLFPMSHNAGSIAIINRLAAKTQTVRRLTSNCGTKLTGAKRSKRTKMKVDDERDALVIVVNETLHRHQWSSECVVKVVGSGAHVRKAQIRWPDGKIVLKSRSKIGCLELDSD